jgi:uncharacterized protein (DUF433 family)
MTHDPTAVITVDPARNFGAPSINGGPTADVVAGMVWAGDPVHVVAEEYGITGAAVLVACWYVAWYGTRTQRRRWKTWADDFCPELAHGEYDRIPDPPNRTGGDPR